MAALDPLFPEVPATTLNEIIDGYIWQNSYTEVPLLRYFRASGAYNPFPGGNAMQTPYLYAGVQGGFVAPGQDVTVNRKQMVSADVFVPKLIETHTLVEEFQTSVLNYGPEARVGLLETYMEQLVQGLDFLSEGAMYHHGQPLSSGVSDNRSNYINGFSEAMNDGVTPSWDGNVFTTYGQQARNGSIGAALNSTPIWVGGQDGNPAPIDYIQLLRTYKAPIGKPTIGITGWSGYSAIASSFQRQQRYETRDDQNINWSGIKFEDATIFDDDIVPTPIPKPTLTPLFNNPNEIKTGTFTVGANQANSFNQLPPQNTVVTVGEVLFWLDLNSWEFRPSQNPDFNYKMMEPIRYPNNPTTFAQYLRHSFNMYTPTPRRHQQVYGFASV